MSDAGQMGSSVGDDGHETSLAAPVTLLIGSSSSRCGACNRNADPNENAHDMVTMIGEGCGARYTHVANTYMDHDGRVREMRPDLVFAGIEAPTPARPVPPVVPDSEPVLVASLAEAVAAIRKRNWAEQVVPDSDGEVQPLDLSDDERAGLLTALDELHGPSGSGVVPDKPALTPTTECRDCGEPKQAGGKCCAYWETGWQPNASVPAVTDDEAATEVIRTTVDTWWGDANAKGDLSETIVADLRSAGFLIVHHTKET